MFITIQCQWLGRSISEFESRCDLYFSPSVSSPVGVFLGRGGSVEPLNHGCGVRVYDRRQRRGCERHFDLWLLYRLMKGRKSVNWVYMWSLSSRLMYFFSCYFFINPFKSLTIRRDKKVCGTKMCPAIASGIGIGDARVSHWPIVFPAPSNCPISLCEI